MNPTEKSYRGTCFCGAVEVEVTGEPAGQGFCHCTSCRTWSAAPVNAFILWKPESVKITRGESNVAAFQKSENARRKYCRVCGGHLMTDHPVWKLVDVYSATTPTFPFRPAIHVNYQERVLPLHDGLPKMKDLPKEMGGSGETLPE